MLQNGIKPCVANPAEKVTACCSAMPTSNALSGMAFIIIFNEHPLGIAGVTPIILLFFSASSTIVSPNTSWYFGGCGSLGVTLIISPVSLLNKPGECHTVSFPSSENLYPLPFLVSTCKIFGPGISFKSFKTCTKRCTSCPSTGPKYLNFNDSNILLCLSNDVFKAACTFDAISRALVPKLLNLPSNFQTSSFTLLYVCDVVISVRYSLSAPTLGSMLMQLSLSTTNKFA